MRDLPGPDSTRDGRLADLLERCLEDVRLGRLVDCDRLVAENPDLADRIRAGLEGLSLVECVATLIPREDSALAAAHGYEGRELGDFRLLREVGRGGMGVVYEAEQISLRRRVALKVLPFAKILDARQLQRFRNEAQAAAQLHHTHIVPVYAVGQERGVHYYAMQFIEGRTLEQVISEMKASPRAGGGTSRSAPVEAITGGSSSETPGYCRAVARLGMHAAEALDHAHEQGVVHRDVKPANLMVDTAGQLWITDFGLARFRTDLEVTATGDLVGTLRYMSPEQVRTKRGVLDHRTDTYSLGATMYELLTLQPAVAGGDAHEVLQRILHEEPKAPRRLNAAVSADLETILMKAMAKEPDARYATAQEMADDLRRYVEDKPVVARRPTIVERAARWSRRHAAIVVAAVVALVAAVAAMGTATYRIARAERSAVRALRRADDGLSVAQSAVDEFLMGLGVPDAADHALPRLPGRTLAQRVLLEKALEFYEKFVVARADARAQMNRGRILATLGRWDEALEAYDASLALAPLAAAVHSNRGGVLKELGRSADALVAHERAVELAPESALAHYNHAGMLLTLGRNDDAVAAYARSIALDPGMSVAHYGSGVALRACGRYEDALAAFDRAIALEPRYALARNDRGTLLAEQMGRTEDALAEFDRAAELEPDDPSNHDNRGIALQNLGRPGLAVEAFDRALALDSTRANVHYNRGLALSSMGRIEDALAAYGRAIDLDPTYSAAHTNKGILLRTLGRHEQALAEHDLAIGIDPADARAHANRGNSLKDLGRLEQALAAYDRALALDPDLPVHVPRGSCLLGLHRHQDALTAFDRALAAKPGDTATQLRRADALLGLGRFDDASSAYERLVALAPDDVRCLDAFAWFLATSSDPARRDAARAVGLASRAVEVAPREGGCWRTLGVACYRAAQWPEAVTALETSMELRSGGDAYDWLVLAMAEWQLFQEAEARIWHETALAWVAAHGSTDEELLRFRDEANALLGPVPAPR